MQKTITITLSILLAIGLFPIVEAGDPHLKNGNYTSGIFYLWHRGQHDEYDYFMNADENGMVNSEDSGTMVSTGSASYTAFFEQDPNYPNEKIYIDISIEIVAKVHAEFDKEVDKVNGALKEKDGDFLGGVELDGKSGDYIYVFKFKSKKENVTNNLEFQFRFEYNSPGTVSYTIYTDGSSFITLPLLRDTDLDGIVDKYDEDDDNDGYTDTQEQQNNTNQLDANSKPIPATQQDKNNKTETQNLFSMQTVGIIAIVVIIIGVIGIFLWYRKKD